MKCRCFRVPELTECFGEYENDVNKMQKPLQLPDVNPVEHLWKLLDHCVR